MDDICQEGRSQKSASQNRHKVHPTGSRGNWGWDLGGDKAHLTRKSAPVKLLIPWAALARESTKRRPNRVWAKILNLGGLGLGSACNSGPSPYRAAGSLSRVDGESTHLWEWPEHCECSPHTPVTFVCSAPPSPQHKWTSEPKQETTSNCVCQGRN